MCLYRLLQYVTLPSRFAYCVVKFQNEISKPCLSFKLSCNINDSPLPPPTQLEEPLLGSGSAASAPILPSPPNPPPPPPPPPPNLPFSPPPPKGRGSPKTIDEDEKTKMHLLLSQDSSHKTRRQAAASADSRVPSPTKKRIGNRPPPPPPLPPTNVNILEPIDKGGRILHYKTTTTTLLSLSSHY